MLTDRGGIVLPRSSNLEWWREHPQPFVWAVRAGYGTTLAGADVSFLADNIGACDFDSEVGFRPTYEATGWSDGTPAIAFNGIDQRFTQQNVAQFLSEAPAAAARSLVLHVRPRETGRTQGLYSWLSANRYGMCALNSNARLTLVNGAYSYDSPNDTPAFVTNQDTVIVYSQAPGAGNSSMYCNGRRFTIPTAVVPGMADNDVIGASLGNAVAPGGFYFYANMLFKQAAMAMNAFDEDDYSAVCSLILGRQYANIVCDGNSLTQAGWPLVAAGALGQARGMCTVTNVAFGGATTPQLYARLNATIAPLRRNACRNILVIWEVSNDIWYNHPCFTDEAVISSAGVVTENVWRYTRDACALGFEVIVMTPTVRSTFSARQLACSALASEMLRVGYREHGAVACLSPDLVPALANPDNYNFFLDGTHFTIQGYAVVSSLAIAGLAERIETGMP
jgi:hypothetical protein